MPSSMFLPAAVADRDVNPSVEEAGKQPGQCDIIPYPCEEKWNGILGRDFHRARVLRTLCSMPRLNVADREMRGTAVSDFMFWSLALVV